MTTHRYIGDDTTKKFITYSVSGTHTGTPSNGSTVQVWQPETGTTNVLMYGGNGTFRTPGSMILPAVEWANTGFESYDNTGTVSRPASTYVAVGGKTIAAAIRLLAAGSNTGTIWTESLIVGDAGDYFGIHHTTVAGVHKLFGYSYSGGSSKVTAGIVVSLDTDYVVELRHDGATLRLTVYSTAGGAVSVSATVAAGNTDNLSSRLQVSQGTGTRQFGDVILVDSDLGDGNAETVSIITRYLPTAIVSRKTIKPAGGGDYTTLQSWEDWVDSEASARQEAECYDGDAGAVTFAGWTATPDALNHPIIYAASGNKHDGTSTVQGARLVSTTGLVINAYSFTYLEIEDIFINWPQVFNGGAIGFGTGTGSATLIVDGCVFYRGTNSAGQKCIQVLNNNFGGSGNNTFTLRNSAFYIGATETIYIGATSHAAAAKVFNVNLINNTIVNTGTNFSNGILFVGTDCTFNTEIWNNAFYSCTSAFSTGGANGTRNGGYNASNDATADDAYATGALINRVATTDFVSPASSCELLETGGLFNAGTDTSGYGVTDDIIGTTRGATYDIGAWQIPEAADIVVTMLGGASPMTFVLI